MNVQEADQQLMTEIKKLEETARTFQQEVWPPHSFNPTHSLVSFRANTWKPSES